MISSARRAVVQLQPRLRLSTRIGSRWSSSSTNILEQHPCLDDEKFVAKPPAKLDADIAEGIATMTQFLLKHGAASQRIKVLAEDLKVPTIAKWQKMMQIFLTTQLHVLASLGYSADEKGLTQYASDLQAYMVGSDDTMQTLMMDSRRETWRTLVAQTFAIDPQEIPTLSIVDARNWMHKVASKMIEPVILQKIADEAGNATDDDPEVEIALKHEILQRIVIDTVYLGGEPSLVEEGGFGPGAIGYAKAQCAMADHEADPLVAQYAASSMQKIWEAAGLDMEAIQKAGHVPPPPA